jgi:hypothetical protein
MFSAELIKWIPVFSFLAYCPVLCYLDGKYRDIKTHALWLPLIAINMPVLIAGYLTGLYPLPLALISALAILMWFSMVFIVKLPGADFVWLSLISLFVVLDPVTGLPFMQMFSFFLIGMTAATYWAIFLDNLFRKHINSLSMERGIPYLITISVAFIAAVLV